MGDDVGTLVKNIAFVFTEPKFRKFQRTDVDVSIPQEKVRGDFEFESLRDIFQVARLDDNLFAIIQLFDDFG